MVVIERTKNKNNKSVWLCKCDCGKYKTATGSELRYGKVKSCGCMHNETLKKGQNLMKQKTYKTKEERDISKKFSMMKTRCYNSKATNYKHYGGRGIQICDEWLKNRKKFIEWALNNGYKFGLTIDRIDVNGNYEPSNCRWITALEQSNNKTTSKIIKYKGKSKTIAEWSRITGIKEETLQGRYNRGFSIEEIFSNKDFRVFRRKQYIDR